MLGIFDTSVIVAVSITYLLLLKDASFVDLADDEPEIGMKPIIIFVIVICSIFGLLLMILGTVFVSKVCCRKKSLLIKMDNDIQFKGRQIGQKHPMTKGSDLGEVKQSDLEPLGPRTVKISDLMVS